MSKGKILVVDDEEILNDLLSNHLQNQGYTVTKAYDGLTATELVDNNDYDIVILDVFLPKKHGLDVLKHIVKTGKNIQVIMATGYSDISSAVESLKMGAFDFLLKPFDMNVLKDLLERAIKKREEILKNQSATKMIPGIDLIGESKPFKKLLEKAEVAAQTNSPVLILGPSGSGKDCIAQFIHSMSSRKNHSFVPINCASVPLTLLESELFGYEKGAFTSAFSAKLGLVEQADLGTLFLDEIGEVPLEMQPKLLRFIETGEFRRVGSTKTEKVDVRIVAASNRDLEAEVDNKRFRGDLYYRIRVITLYVPSLKERKDDIPLLADYFLKKSTDAKKQLSESALKKLMSYDYPGNVRELSNIIKKAEITSNSDIITDKDIFLPEQTIEQIKTQLADNTDYSLSEMEKKHIEEVLKNNNWNKNKTAEILGISLKTLYTKLKEYGISMNNPEK
ncbi:MAG TPA: sigma-54 dependent transcriptional regulator [Bacteroidota bacterium]|nr:sigma-54 dependent transcriptional regulator [Bacteroidota bacterium]